MGTVLIAGCGDLGGALGARLATRGRRVIGLRRRPVALPAGVEALRADLGDRASLAGLPAGIEQVVYTAAAGGRDEAAYRAAYLTGLANLLAALPERPARILFCSSTAVYGQHRGEWVDEGSPVEPEGFPGRVLLEAERLAAGSGAACTVVRLAGIYGPGRDWLIRRVRDGGPCQADPPVYTNRIHRDDCAGILAHLLELADPRACYLGVDDRPAPQCEVMDWIAARLGLPDPPRAQPGAAARAGKRCRNRRLRASGYRLAYPSYREGYAPLLDGMPAGKRRQ